MTKKTYALLALLPISQMLLLSAYQNHRLSALTTLAILLNLLADLVLIYLFFWGFQKKRQERKLAELQYLQEAERRQNEALEQKHAELLSMRADLNQQLSRIRLLLEKGDTDAAEADIASVQQTLDHTRIREYCQHQVVNAILTEKDRQCQALGIRTDYQLLIPRKLPIDPLHLCSIFSNLMDNAIEALRELPQEQRSLTLHGALRGSYLLVRLENPASRKHAERPIRTGHGYGSQILQDIADTYDGYFQCDFDNGVFRAIMAVKVERIGGKN